MGAFSLRLPAEGSQLRAFHDRLSFPPVALARGHALLNRRIQFVCSASRMAQESETTRARARMRQALITRLSDAPGWLYPRTAV